MVSKRYSLIAFIVVLLVGVGVLAIANTSTAPSVVPPINVEVASVQVMTTPLTSNSVGNLVAMQHVTISSEVDGRVTKLFFKDGSYVPEGAALVQLDSVWSKSKVSLMQRYN